MNPLRARRGSVAALAVGVAILALYVALQPGPRPESVEVAPTTTTTAAPTTTIDPGEELCRLAREFEEGAREQDVIVVSKLAEGFYDRARMLALESIRPEFDAAARYYIEFNNIGENYEYDLLATLASPDGQRWRQLVFGDPLGVAAARANVAFLCQVELPPPPTITTTTTTRPRTTLPPDTTPAPPDGSTPPGSTPPATGAPGTAPPASTPG